MIPFRSITIVAVAILFPLNLLAQQNDPRLDRMPPQIRDQVAVFLDSARSAGLPTAPLIQKALEGTSKQASDKAIMAALRSLADALRVAKDVLGLESSVDEVSAGAFALRAGARPADLARLRAIRPAGSLAVPLGVLSDLVARGVPADTATQVVLILAERAKDEDYIAFRRGVDRDIALGVPPVSSALGQLNVSARSLNRAGGRP